VKRELGVDGLGGIGVVWGVCCAEYASNSASEPSN